MSDKTLEINASVMQAAPVVSTLDLKAISSVAKGACFMASGGGGSLQLVLNEIIPCFFDEDTEVGLVDVSQLNSDSDWGTVISGMGSPTKLFSDPTLVGCTVDVFETVAQQCKLLSMADEPGRFESFEALKYCVPVEVGAVNSIVPMIVANNLKSLGLKVVDIDGTGRSMPTLSLSTYVGKLELYPTVVGGHNKQDSSDPYNSAVLNVQGEDAVESALMGLINSNVLGYAAGLGLYAASGPQLKQSNAITSSMTTAKTIGEILENSTGTDRVNGIIECLQSQFGVVAKEIFTGTVANMTESTDGLDSGYVEMSGCDTNEGQRFKIYFENENMWAAMVDSDTGTELAYIVGPDSINYLTDTGDVFDNSDLWDRYNDPQKAGDIKDVKIRIIAVKVHPRIYMNDTLMSAWAIAVANNGGPDTYIDGWMDH
jgi:DUF917 family protein